MQNDPSITPPGEAPPPSPIPLDYQPPQARRRIEITPYMSRGIRGAIIALGVVTFLLPTNWMQPFGLAIVFAGVGMRVWCDHERVSRVLRMQFLLASVLCAAGMLNVALGMNGATPPGYSYWFTENQTYGLRRSRVLRPAWISVVGLFWMLFIGTVHARHVLARRGAGRNNRRPPEQE